MVTHFLRFSRQNMLGKAERDLAGFANERRVFQISPGDFLPATDIHSHMSLSESKIHTLLEWSHLSAVQVSEQFVEKP